MRHRRKGRVLGRSPSHQRALLRNLAAALMLTEREYEAGEVGAPKVAGRIITTVAKAKEVRPVVERSITIAKRGLKSIEQAKSSARPRHATPLLGSSGVRAISGKSGRRPWRLPSPPAVGWSGSSATSRRPALFSRRSLPDSSIAPAATPGFSSSPPPDSVTPAPEPCWSSSAVDRRSILALPRKFRLAVRPGALALLEVVAPQSWPL